MGTGTGPSSKTSRFCKGGPEPVPIFHKLSAVSSVTAAGDVDLVRTADGVGAMLYEGARGDLKLEPAFSFADALVGFADQEGAAAIADPSQERPGRILRVVVTPELRRAGGAGYVIAA